LTEAQKESLFLFLLSDSEKLIESPLPILGGIDNRNRVDPEIAMPEYGIYRDRWERKVTISSYKDYILNRRDVRTILDYPELERKAGSAFRRTRNEVQRKEEPGLNYSEPEDESGDEEILGK
jgi:hypothetical protein